MKKFYVICAAILLAGSSMRLLYAQYDSVILDANESPPYWSLKLPYDGMCGEIVHAISSEAGLISYIRFAPLKRLIEDDSNNDLGDPQFYMGNQDFAAIVPIAIYNTAVFYYKPNHKKELLFNRMEDLKGYRVGVLKGTLVEHSIFDKAGIIFEESYNQESLIKKLRLGRIDLVIEIDLVGQRIISKLFPDEVDMFEKFLIPNSATPIAILMGENYPDAKVIGKKYRDGLARIIQNGVYQKILEKYYGVGGVPNNWFKDMKKYEYIYGLSSAE